MTRTDLRDTQIRPDFDRSERRMDLARLGLVKDVGRTAGWTKVAQMQFDSDWSVQRTDPA